VELSRLGGGIGTRGPGETKLESDRRRINNRIRTLDRELRDLSRVRKVKRKRRERQEVATFALVGYTNAGKSSLLNSLTGAGVLVEDQLFSTLDPVTRRIGLPANRRAVITDTVGFISHLPHQLVEAFKSTLEEVKEADLLLHVIDASSPSVLRNIDAVEEVLEELGAGDMPAIYILNKSDLLHEGDRNDLARDVPGGLFTSTLTGEGLDELMERMSYSISSSRVMHLTIPHREGELLSLLYRRGQVHSMEADEEGYHIAVDVPLSLSYRFEGYKTMGTMTAADGEDLPPGPLHQSP
jgi:GTPase